VAVKRRMLVLHDSALYHRLGCAGAHNGMSSTGAVALRTSAFWYLHSYVRDSLREAKLR
jgi:hypothetical protein